MYAVIELGSTQFKVSEGDVIEADRIDVKEGKNIKLDKVLLFSKGHEVRIGQPYLKDVKVEATVMKQHAARKVVAVKFKKRKHSLTTKASRHKLTTLNITKIDA
jgi:large subunit ribosomal protein L21